MSVRGLAVKGVSMVAALALFAGAMALQPRVDATRPPHDLNDYKYLPGEKLLTHFTAGLDTVIADLLWIQCCTYVGRQVKSGWDFTWLEQMVRTVTRLDPYFVDAYRYGAMFLASLKRQDDTSLELLHAGMIANPYAWELPYEAAMIYLLNRRDQPDSRAMAARYLAMAAETGHAPQFVIETAAAIQGQLNLNEVEVGMWQKLAEGDNALLRDLARQKLLEVRIRDNVRVLNDLIDRYRQEQGQPLARLDLLVDKGYIRAIPPDPMGGEYFLAEDGRAYNTTVLRSETDRARGNLSGAVRTYERKYGSLPPSLDALIHAGIMDGIPDHPWPGKQWGYNPVNGDVH
ncbi:MAG: hypothetical protein GC168_17565 [Candidatus Hydrogenedens sp.]|nr:hypothetical protein [Candidatus Hydrogenedens sp.]